MKIKFWLLCSIFFCSCGVQKNRIVSPSGKSATIKTPPIMVEIDDNFYADKTEMNNFNYESFVVWAERVYGKNSEQYLFTLPDTAVWLRTPLTDGNEKFAPLFEKLAEVYFQSDRLRNFPVVGISFEQAKAYCHWRGERVLEYILRTKKEIPIDTLPNSETVFTIEKYYAGKYYDISPDKNIPYPEYTLPTIAEWEKMARGKSPNNDANFGIDLNKNRLTENSFPFNIYEYAHRPERDTGQLSITMPTFSFPQNDFGIYEIIGNVAEMTATKGTAKGGSWMHKLDESKISNHQAYKEPTSWLGFRCVCRWKFYEE